MTIEKERKDSTEVVTERDLLTPESLGVLAEHESLRVVEAKVHEVQLELIAPFQTSFGRFDKKTHYFPEVTFQDEEGNTYTGVGECPPLPAPWYDGEDEGTVKSILTRSIVPAIGQGESVTGIESFTRKYGFVVGNGMAKVGVEGAYWDAVGKMLGKPVYELWGGTNTKVAAGTSVGLEATPKAVVDKVEYAVEKMGVARVKIKIKPGSDVAYVEAIRNRYPNLPLQVDANAAYDLFDPAHVQALKELDQYNLLMIEQPGPNDDILDHARQLASLQTPICLDESILHTTHARQAIELWQQYSRTDKLIINIKPPRVGGFYEAMRIAKLCEANGISTWCGGMLESAIGKAANAHFSTLGAVNLPGDHVAQGAYYQKDVATSPNYHSGVIQVSPAPGWGIENLNL